MASNFAYKNTRDFKFIFQSEGKNLSILRDITTGKEIHRLMVDSEFLNNSIFSFLQINLVAD